MITMACRSHLLCAIIFACIYFPALALAQENSPLTSPPAPTPAATPAGITDPEKATRAWLDTTPPADKAKSDAYFEGGYWLLLWNFLVNAGVCLLLLSTRLSARLRDLAAKITRIRPLQAALYGAGSH